jgi:Asp-tRNA(Asn)/Glu-tRNA(Gln) amidotransferase A subunit family amidase
MEKTTEYDLTSIKLPRFAGKTFELFVKLVENPASQSLVRGSLLQNAGITSFRRFNSEEMPVFMPLYPSDDPGEQVETGEPSFEDMYALEPEKGGFRFNTIYDYHQAYKHGSTTPEEVARRVIESIETCQQGDPRMNIFIAWQRDDILSQARNSTERFRRGEILGLLDGVPVAVKDEVDMVPFPTTVGTRFLARGPAKQDSTVVARMRAAGALLIGKANMHEIGIGVNGLNPHHGTARNPYNPNHHTGGSSSGPAAAVAAGICPVAIGADGGGSIRIPSSFCGLVGIKSTFGRVSEFGAAPLTWSMGHLGPLAGSALDACLAYATLAGPDPCDPNSLDHPPVWLDRLTDRDLCDMKLGVYWPWFQHADPEVVETCTILLDKLKSHGAGVVEIEIPDLEPARVAHLITITSEMLTALGAEYDSHQRELALDTRLNLAMARNFTSQDYVLAQRVRAHTIANFQAAFRLVDVIVTPTTAITAPPIRPDAQPDGESDLTQLSEIMRFVPFSNLTGHPAISFPAGYSNAGLPIGFQAIGRPWEEHRLLRLACAAEQLVPRKAPEVFFDLLPES